MATYTEQIENVALEVFQFVNILKSFCMGMDADGCVGSLQSKKGAEGESPIHEVRS